MRGVRVYNAFVGSGYGISGIDYVRALVNAGVPVHWTPFDWPRRGVALEPLSQTEALSRLSGWQYEPIARDIAALLRATSSPIACDTALLHTTAEHLPQLYDPGCRNVVYTAWEATRIPAHWNSLLNAMDAVLVPSRCNQEAFVASGVRSPVVVVPHIARSYWHEFGVKELDAFKANLGLAPARLTLLTIGTGLPRKNLGQLIRSFVEAFDHTSPIQLLIKTSKMTEAEKFPHAQVEFEQKIHQIATEMGREFSTWPLIRWIADDQLSPRAIDALHAIADCFVSFSHGEGFGLGAFDAASNGTPVVMPAWGGQRDFLSEPWLGAVPCSLAPAAVWPMNRPSYWPDQRWAVMRDIDCVEALQRIPKTIDALRANARMLQARIVDEFSELRVAQRLIAALEG